MCVAPMSPIRYSYSHSPLDMLASRYVLAATMAPMYFGAGPTRVTVLVCVTGIGYLLIPVRYWSHPNQPICRCPTAMHLPLPH